MDIQKTRYKKLVTRVESHASAVSLLESGEQRYIKAINNNNNKSSEHSKGKEEGKQNEKLFPARLTSNHRSN